MSKRTAIFKHSTIVSEHSFIRENSDSDYRVTMVGTHPSIDNKEILVSLSSWLVLNGMPRDDLATPERAHVSLSIESAEWLIENLKHAIDIATNGVKN